jgi:hypothetical protein
MPTLDTSNVVTFNDMFALCSSLTCLSNLDTTAIISDQTTAFTGCSNLTTPDQTTRDTLMTVAGKGTWTNPGTCA